MRLSIDGDLGAIVEGIANDAKVDINSAIQEFGFDLFEAVLKATPGPGNSIAKGYKPTGFLRASWFVSINDPLGGKPIAQEGAAGLAQAKARQAQSPLAISEAEAGDTLFFLNGASYARFVEFGTARQRPRAFVRKTVARAGSIAEETVRKFT